MRGYCKVPGHAATPVHLRQDPLRHRSLSGLASFWLWCEGKLRGLGRYENVLKGTSGRHVRRIIILALATDNMSRTSLHVWIYESDSSSQLDHGKPILAQCAVVLLAVAHNCSVEGKIQ